MALSILTPPTPEAFRALERFQRDDLKLIGDYEPAETLQTVAKNGGVVLAAYRHPEDILQPVAFAFGFLGKDAAGLKLCSHMLGVHPNFRDRRLGQRLKFAQAAQAYQQGLQRMTWTFDPLELRNGYLNIHKLAGYAAHYYENLYGTMHGINSDLPSDRLLVTWEFTALAERLEALALHPADIPHTHPSPPFSEDAVRLRCQDDQPVSVALPLDGAPVWLELPYHMKAIRDSDSQLALAWRLALREQMGQALQQGYVVRDVYRNKAAQRFFYLLTVKS